MSVCSKCHQTEATIHLSTYFNGNQERQMHFCQACAPFGLDTPQSLEDLMAKSLLGKKCEFCGKAALSGVDAPGGAICWCMDCGIERSRLIQELLVTEHPEWKQQVAESPFMSSMLNAEFTTWFASANERAMQMLRERKKQEDGDSTT